MPKLTWNMLWAVLGALFIAVVAYYSFTFITAPRIDIRKFTGGIVSVEGETIKLHGVFSGPLGTVPTTLAAARDFSFRVDGSTVFRKITIQLPTSEELSATGGKFNLQDRPRKEETGSLADLTNFISAGGTYIEADFPVSIHNSKNPIASHIIYRVMTEGSFPMPQ